jgi:hypothetical protein
MPGRKLLISVATMCTLLDSAMAQQFIYPAQGQSWAQQQQDQLQCSQWATQQTGFNPAFPPPMVGSSGPPPGPGPVGGAIGGAALGALGGAIGGNAGRGAAIGAGAGALFGGIRNARYAQAQQNFAGQQNAAWAMQRSNYLRAMNACMVGRGYTVN